MRQVHTLQLREMHTPWHELMEIAHANSRCIDWASLTLELFTGKICGAERIHGKFYEMSRPVRPGEVIDYFVSHSWYDSGELKMDALRQLAETFKAKHHRYPTFWLDKVCIDQDQIGDCLKVLPINIMSCAYFVMIVGPTYITRLWCVWELCTLTAFMNVEHAMASVELLVLEPFTPASALESLRTFDVSSARCYDPNEEAKVKTILRALGGALFNQKVRGFGEQYAQFIEARKSRLHPQGSCRDNIGTAVQANLNILGHAVGNAGNAVGDTCHNAIMSVQTAVQGGLEAGPRSS